MPAAPLNMRDARSRRNAKPQARERACVRRRSGKRLWSYAYDADYRESAFDKKYPQGPISTPIVADGRIYTWGAAGNLLCLDALQGGVVWKKNVQKEFANSYIDKADLP